MKFFSELRICIDKAIEENAGIKIDLQPLRLLDLSSGLILVAELDRYQRLKGVKLTPSEVHKWDKTIIEFLRNIGFFKILKTNIAPHYKSSSKIILIPFVSGINTDGYLASVLRKKLQKLIKPNNDEYFLKIYEPLIESMKNSIQHAYDESINTELNNHYYGKRWWMCASFNKNSSLIEIVFLDLGISIPRSLKNYPTWEELKYYTKARSLELEQVSDNTLILLALKYGITITLEPFRGKGFKNIKEPANAHIKNSVEIISRQGRVTVSGVNPEAPFSPDRDATHSLLGTLIKWYIYVPKSTDIGGK
ncbi:hypothetical protein CIW82_13335 [Acetobacter tropicalis]|uniref:Uncharacterized protein n=1 Tax=Acetobacter tropicalis TaxID=104102 RepID=A0A291PJ72_9PROT|nr:hypothetical protein CIW82_13335 [Acetobacter tropicalis]